MAQVKNRDELYQRLQMAVGEEILAFGWGNLGMKNVFVALTPSALFLEFVSFTGNTKEIKRIPFEELEFIFSLSGDASTPKYMKFNAQARITDAITSTLLYKTRIGKVNYIRFSKMPFHNKNDDSAHEIIRQITSIKPELVKEPDLKAMRKSSSKRGCLLSFLQISLGLTVVFSVIFKITLDESWVNGLLIGSSTGFIFGAIFAPLIPVFKRMLTGRG